jgi:hypothetical protein
MGYFNHLRIAFGVAARLMGASLAAAVHGLVPDWFTQKAGDVIAALDRELKAPPITRPKV